ncbi:MAG: bifunctional YncE family protein/alkaline phosphatase family protein, partial [Bryobacteraceae bacterium]|nr:bifunctional YncE family protein/alkaline phosphatase family protein [Bryobacteraceae bacterium]
IDLAQKKVTHSIPVELHPTALVLDEPRARLYVANSNKDSISVIDTNSQRVLQTIAIQPFAQRVAGIAPVALAVSADGAKLYAACGGINAVAVISTATGKLEGLIPTAWYPNSISLSPDGKHLAIGALLGPGSGWRDAPAKRFVHAYRGSVHVVDLPDAAQLASYTTAVAENNHVPLAGSVVSNAAPADRRPRAIPYRSGDPSLIEHVVYIVKENRTYDQVLGALPRGNGDPSLVMFGRDITPNHHRLSEQFVTLDNFYATGGNSADGHQWLTQANETSYALWPGYQGRSYPFDGSDPIAYSSAGFIWDYAVQRGKSVKIYGEFAGVNREGTPDDRLKLLREWKDGADFSTRWNFKAPIDSVNKLMAHQFPPYDLSIPDVARAQIFLKDLAQWERDGKMPHLAIVQLPADHTYGTSPRRSTPKAMVADNDLALGLIVEGISKSKFWPKTAIFVVEDDAQNGVDHVDGHRTVALAISPYSKRGSVDSTFYSHQSLLKTMELILGLPTMSLFDLIAHDLRASFTDTPDLAPYAAETPKQDLLETNPPVSALKGAERQGALASARMKWSVPDAVPTDRLNRILWHHTRGWNTPFPGVKQAIFAPLSLEVDDDDR